MFFCFKAASDERAKTIHKVVTLPLAFYQISLIKLKNYDTDGSV